MERLKMMTGINLSSINKPSIESLPFPIIVPCGVVCFIIHNTLFNRPRREGEARTRQAVDLAFQLLTHGALMINNTSHSLWDRLQQKTLNQQFTNRLNDGLKIPYKITGWLMQGFYAKPSLCMSSYS